MIKRLTPEREKEIRAMLTAHDACKLIDDSEYLDHADEFRELLAEIDALRAELDDARNSRLAIKYERLKEECVND